MRIFEKHIHEMVMLRRQPRAEDLSLSFQIVSRLSWMVKVRRKSITKRYKNKFIWKSYFTTTECIIKRKGDHRKFRKRHTTDGKLFTCFCVENTQTFIILGIAPKSELKQTSLLTCPCHSAVLISRMDSGISPDNTLLNCSFNVTFGSWNQEWHI